ncbi:MAG: class I SAM-dependent methyltransferase [Gloeobacteraceae cyanobacterium ES-bin-144]|nr:class I SAM-dependent methyltransferase [Verrucomicrobiales bacterium]
MPIIDHLLGNQTVRKAIWKLWYPFLTRRLSDEGVIFLNYAYETEPPMGIALSPEEEPDRTCIQLYHHVGSLRDLRDKRVLEVSCGHGGGASYLTRIFQPAHYTGLDLNPTGIEFCRKHHQVPGLDFIQGDAENLPFEAESFDAVINVEASHCYPDFPRFLDEVARVLKPGGSFQYADFRFKDSIPAWEKAIEECPLELKTMTDIGPCVIRGLQKNSARSQALLERKMPRFLMNLGRDFAGVKDSRVYNALVEGELSYRSYHFVKFP